jgi:hypothetical protein
MEWGRDSGESTTVSRYTIPAELEIISWLGFYLSQNSKLLLESFKQSLKARMSATALNVPLVVTSVQ